MATAGSPIARNPCRPQCWVSSRGAALARQPRDSGNAPGTRKGKRPALGYRIGSGAVTRALPRPRALLLVLVASGLLATGCGDDDNGESDDVAGPDLERYCELTAELNRAGEEAFHGLEKDPQATEKDFEAAEKGFVESHQAQLNELEQVAPEEISKDVETLSNGLRARAGLGPGVDEAEEGAADKRVAGFEKQNC